jgi:hypothetical protein
MMKRNLIKLSYENKQEYHDLLMLMGSFTSKVCGNLNKIYEKTTDVMEGFCMERRGEKLIKGVI